MILVATDGVFDNVPEGVLVAELQRAQGESDAVALQAVANSIAWMARNLSFDGEFMSPFAKNARQNGIDARGKLHPPYLYCLIQQMHNGTAAIGSTPVFSNAVGFPLIFFVIIAFELFSNEILYIMVGKLFSCYRKKKNYLLFYFYVLT